MAYDLIRPKAPPRFYWSRGNVAELKRLHGLKYSHHEIASLIGAPSKSAVTCKLARLGLTAHAPPGQGFRLALPVPKPNIPDKQQRLLTFIRAKLDDGWPFPTNTEIAAYMGWKSDRSAIDALQRLAADGHLVGERSRDRSGRISYKWTLPSGSR